MSFDQFKLAKSSNQSRGIFDTYIYRTEDSLSEVQSSGYFNASRYVNEEPDQWFSGVIEVLCADGFVRGNLDENGDFAVYAASSGDWSLCAKPAKNAVAMGISNDIWLNVYKTVTIDAVIPDPDFVNDNWEYVGNGRFQNKSGGEKTAKGYVTATPQCLGLTDYNLFFCVGLWDGAVIVPDETKEKSFPTTVNVNVGNSNIDAHQYEYEIDVPADGIVGFCVKRTNDVLIDSDCAWYMFSHTLRGE